MNEKPKSQGVLYPESRWFRCWIANYRDGGWVVGEMNYEVGLYFIVNSDNNGQLVIPERYIAPW